MELGVEKALSSKPRFGLVAGALVGLVEEAFEFVGEDAVETT
jgi:hypothetical protein